jgi:hypothetical protein
MRQMMDDLKAAAANMKQAVQDLKAATRAGIDGR